MITLIRDESNNENFQGLVKLKVKLKMPDCCIEYNRLNNF